MTLDKALKSRINEVLDTLISSWKTSQGEPIRDIIETSATELGLDASTIKPLADADQTYEDYYTSALEQGAPHSLSCVFSDGARSHASAIRTNLEQPTAVSAEQFIDDLRAIKEECEEQSEFYTSVFAEHIPTELLAVLKCYQKNIIPSIDDILAQLEI